MSTSTTVRTARPTSTRNTTLRPRGTTTTMGFAREGPVQEQQLLLRVVEETAGIRRLQARSVTWVAGGRGRHRDVCRQTDRQRVVCLLVSSCCIREID
mmetsp:Transcript_44154/g.110045  ORF Transcript_44154/g.110045 Transcript_44154/m.110045 type:complete len:98 (-) Transcript_44154:116-409(-)